MNAGEQACSRAELHAELEAGRASFHELLAQASRAELRAPTRGTRWSNEELLFHMLFGYLIVRALLPMVRAFGRLPLAPSRRFAALLDAATRPFDVVNYWGSRLGARVIDHRRMGNVMDNVIAGLHRRLDAESEDALASEMAFPTRWDPFFGPVMTLAGVYHYAGEHFQFHRHQLSLNAASR